MGKKPSVSSQELQFVADCVTNDVGPHCDILQEIDEHFEGREIPFTYILTEQLPVDALSNNSVIMICTDRCRAGEWISV